MIESVIAEEVQTEAVSEVIQETQAVTEAVTETVQPSGNIGSFLIQNPTFIAVPAVIAVLAGAMAFVKKRSKKTATDDEDAPMSARDRDAVRLAADKPDKKKGKKSKKDKSGKEKKNLSKKVISTIPYQKVLSDDIFYLGKKMYSNVYIPSAKSSVHKMLITVIQYTQAVEEHINLTNTLSVLVLAGFVNKNFINKFQ